MAEKDDRQRARLSAGRQPQSSVARLPKRNRLVLEHSDRRFVDLQLLRVVTGVALFPRRYL